MGRFPRKCKLRGPSGVTSGVTSGYPPGTLYISPGPNLENPAKIRQKSGKIWAKLAKFVKISEIWRKNQHITEWYGINKKTHFHSEDKQQ